MNVEKYKSRERIRIITKHQKELIDEICNLKVDDDFLMQRYRELDDAFENILDAEAKYRAVPYEEVR